MNLIGIKYLKKTTYDRHIIFTDFLSGCDGDFMKKLEEELAYVDPDPGLLNIDTKYNQNISSPQLSPYYNAPGNPLVSQHPRNRKPQVQVPQPKSSPVLGVYGREEGYNLNIKNEDAPLPDVTQNGPKQPQRTPMIVQQVIQSPLYVNLAHGSLQKLPNGRTSLAQVDGVPQLNQSTKPQQPSQPLLIPNNAKGLTPVIIKSDSNFSPVILQSNIINPETQTLMYTSAPVQGKLLSAFYILYFIRDTPIAFILIKFLDPSDWFSLFVFYSDVMTCV